ncbi:hypothetical protein DL765_004935 [Monosporascus sp. GIB2]|nr:hypothetical protein DL765_004935 [Monosporascus sp. GIB2]
MSGIRRDVRAREDKYQQKTRSSKSSRSTNVQPKALESAPPEVKAGGSKEVLIALESDVEEINPLREGETKPGRWSTKKPDPLDPPKRQKNKPPKGVARSNPDDSDSSSSDSSGGPPKKKKNRHSSPSSSSSSSDSFSESGLGLKDSKKSSDEDSKLRWKRFDFSLDKENHLAGWANWELWSNALSLTMEEIGYVDGMKLGQLDQLRLAKAITKTCKRAPLELITGIKKGTKMLRTFRRTYAATGKSRQRSLWKELNKVTYDGGDPVQFTTKFQKLLREVKGCGMRLGTEEQITMFLTAVEDRAGSWCKTIQSVLRQTDYSFQQLIDDFNSEFHDRSNKKKNNGRSANARKGKGNTRDGKPAWNKDGQPLCFNCGKYGHMAKDCPEPQKDKNGKGKKGKRGQNSGQGNNSGNSSQNNRSNSSRNTHSGGQSEEQFIPEGLRDLYRLDGKTFSAHIEDQQLQDLMRWYDKMIQKADTTVASVLESAEAAEATEAVAADCTNCTEIKSPKSPELQAIQSPEPQGTDYPELRLQATESPGPQAIKRPEVTKADCVKPQVADCPKATKATVMGSAMLLHVHSSMENDRDKLLWDLGANVNITNNIGDFERDSILDIRSKGIHIMTGGGPVAATSIGIVKWPLRGPHGENNEVTVKYTLHISDFPLKGYGLGGPFGEKDSGASDLRVTLLGALRDGKVFMTDEVMKKIILWHRRLCHPSTKRLIWTIKRFTGIDLDPSDVKSLPCTACDEGKIRKIPSTNPQRRATYVGEIIWCDVGAVKPVSIENNGYFGLITDDLSRYREYYSFRTKDEVQESLCTYITRIIKRLETLPPDTEGKKRMVQILRLDGGKEFGVTKIENFCAVEGIELIISSAYNQYQNGVAERGIQFLQDEARATTAQMRIPTCFWDLVMEVTTHTVNRTGQSIVRDMTPIECFEDAFESDPRRSHRPDNSHLRIFGSRCTVLIDKNYRTRSEKLAARGAKGVLLGYQGTHNYKVWLLEGGKLLTTPHVTIYKDLEEPGQPPSPKDIIRSLPQPVQKRLRHRQDQETKQIKPRRGRPKKTVPELYTLEAPDEAPELMHELKLALTQKGDDLDNSVNPYPYPFHFHPLLTDVDDEDGYRLHREYIKRLPRYLNGTTNLSLRYRKLDEKHPHKKYNDLSLFGAMDTNFADRAGTAAAEAAGIRNFLTELKLMPKGPIPILEDNTSALKWVTKTQMTRRKRHIRLEYHYVRQEVQEGNISFQYVKSKDNPADGLTKPLDRADFERFVANLGLKRIQND